MRNKRRLILTEVVLTLSLVSSNCFAEDWTIFGTHSCGTWASERKTEGLGDLVVSSWLTAYLSGLNVGRESVDALLNVDAESLYLWMDIHCAHNPLDTLDAAAVRLFEELLERER